jgi:lantibiotic modifying enzyme
MHTDRQKRIINALLLHGSFIENPGLLNGKMGISIFFYHLARKTGNPIYENYAAELIDEIYEEISFTTPYDFEDGLAGIGWGIEYLVQNNFIEADTDEVLEEFDKRLTSLIYSFPPTTGLCNGLVGLGSYLLIRIQNLNSGDEKIQSLINRQLLIHLISEVDRRTQDVSSITREPSPDNVADNYLKTESNNNGEFTFDLTWDYPAMIIFLSKVYLLNVYNAKATGILKRLIVPILEQKNFPSLHSNRLLLAFSLAKLVQSIKQSETEDTSGNFTSSIAIENIIQNLLSGISRDAIAQEIAPDCAFLKNGTMGIAWIYRQLFSLTADNRFEEEENFWKTKSFNFTETDQGYAGFYIAKENKDQALGLLNGLAGIL